MRTEGVEKERPVGGHYKVLSHHFLKVYNSCLETSKTTVLFLKLGLISVVCAIALWPPPPFEYRARYYLHAEKGRVGPGKYWGYWISLDILFGVFCLCVTYLVFAVSWLITVLVFS